jgi:hypothetical protein
LLFDLRKAVRIKGTLGQPPALPREAQNFSDQTRELVGAMGNVEDGYGAGANKTINGLDEGGPVRGIEALTGFVEDEETRPFHQGAGEQGHPLGAGGKAVEGYVRIRQEAEIAKLKAGLRALASGQRVEEANGVVKAGGDDFEAVGCACEVEV